MCRIVYFETILEKRTIYLIIKEKCSKGYLSFCGTLSTYLILHKTKTNDTERKKIIQECAEYSTSKAICIINFHFCKSSLYPNIFSN